VRTLANHTPEHLRTTPRTIPGWTPQAQVFFVTDSGEDICREPGRQHGFRTYEEAVAWVEANRHRAMPQIAGFRVEFW
jgi:hypothetical protein